MCGGITTNDNTAWRLTDDAPVLDDYSAITLITGFDSQVPHPPSLLHEGRWRTL
jgi:hypothetical protein